MGHLNKLHEEYASKGLVVIATSQEPESVVQGFVDEFDAKYPVMIEESDTAGEYGFSAIPRAILISPTGRILFSDHPNRLSTNQIETYLETVRLLPEYPKAMSAVEKAMAKGEYGKAHKKATAALKKDDTKEPAQATLDWIDWLAKTSMDAAKGAAEGGDPYAAYSGYERVEDLFKGLAVAKEAKAAAAALKGDKAHKPEIMAGEKLAKLKDKLKKMSPKKAEKALAAFIKKYGDTKAGAKAKKIRIKKP